MCPHAHSLPRANAAEEAVVTEDKYSNAASSFSFAYSPTALPPVLQPFIGIDSWRTENEVKTWTSRTCRMRKLVGQIWKCPG